MRELKPAQSALQDKQFEKSQIHPPNQLTLQAESHAHPTSYELEVHWSQLQAETEGAGEGIDIASTQVHEILHKQY